MTWIACMYCQQIPCVCKPAVCNCRTWTAGTLTINPFFSTPPLSDADVERIARKLAEILKGSEEPKVTSER